jgi:DNA-binding transcriptional regulator YhcF (GntR family)
MNIELKDSSHSPIYAQVREQIEARIRTKEVGSGELLPSPSTLARKLSVDTGEIQRAYFELEKAGLVKRQTSKDFLGKSKVTYNVV